MLKKMKINNFNLYYIKNSLQNNLESQKKILILSSLLQEEKYTEDGDYPQKRFQMYSPPSGKIKIGRATKAINEFINECFNGNEYSQQKKWNPNPSKWNCTFCAFKEDKKLCGLGANPLKLIRIYEYTNSY